MRGTTRLLLLCVLSTTGCWTDECGIDCNQDGDPDCVAGNLHPTGLPSASPPPPLTLQCRVLNTQPETELEWELTIGGGAPPVSYTVDFGDQTPVHNGSWSGGSDPNGTHPYERSGDFNVQAQARDAAGQTQSCSLAYTAPDPSLRMSCEATPRNGTAPLTVSFEVTRREGCIGPCTVTWYFGDGETHQGGDVTHTYEFPGPSALQTYAAFAELRDSTDRVYQCRRPIQVLPASGGPTDPANHAPSIDTLGANPPSITAGQSTTIAGTTSDPDPGDTVTWQLTFDTANAGTLTPSSGTGPIVSTYTSATGTHGSVSIRATAVDSHGAPAPYRTIVVEVVPLNQPPVIVSLTASPSVITPGGGPTQITATITDPNSDPLTWTLALDPSSAATGTFSATSGSGNSVGASFSATAAPGNQGLAVIRLTARDPAGLTDTRTVNVLVTLAKH